MNSDQNPKPPPSLTYFVHRNLDSRHHDEIDPNIKKGKFNQEYSWLSVRAMQLNIQASKTELEDAMRAETLRRKKAGESHAPRERRETPPSVHRHLNVGGPSRPQSPPKPTPEPVVVPAEVAAPKSPPSMSDKHFNDLFEIVQVAVEDQLPLLRMALVDILSVPNLPVRMNPTQTKLLADLRTHIEAIRSENGS